MPPQTDVASSTGGIVNHGAIIQGVVRIDYDAKTQPFVPSWAMPTDSNEYTPADVLNDVTWAHGFVRTINSGTLRIYRANFAAFGTNANVGGKVAFTYEIA